MSELPARSCGKCPHQGKYERIAENQGDYLETNTVPKPDLIPQAHVTLKDPHLSIPATYYPPDIKQPIVNTTAKYNSPCSMGDNHTLAKMSQCCCEKGQKKAMVEKCAETPYTKIREPESALDIRKPDMMYNTNTQEAKKLGVAPPEFNIKTEVAPIKGILKNAKPCQCEVAEVRGGPPILPGKIIKNQTPQNFKTNPDEVKVPNRECYLPKPEDEFPEQREAETRVLGPWATGRLDWGPLAGLTGVRPVVDKYSIARFSEGEWRTRNKDVLDSLLGIQHQANLLDYNSQEGITQTRSVTDQNQADTTRRLHQREQELHRWKCELERAISAADEEISKILEQRRRLKQSMSVLQLPEAIASECLERRTGRLDPELVRDEVEEELIKEVALTAEIREQFTRTLADIEHQLLEDKTAKNRLEYDWSDKKQANETECVNVALNDRSNVLMFKPGAVGFPDHQSTQETWEKFTRETLEESEITRQRSVALRGTLDAILLNGAKDLRAQADKVEMCLAKRVACTEEMGTRLENELSSLVKRLADIENTIFTLKAMIRRMDIPLKKAHTRLDNRLFHRPRVENCRDDAQYGLVEEVKSISESVAALTSQLQQATAVQDGLMAARSKIEREIMIKRKTLEIDRDRIQLIRSYYPSATAMAGF